jgi:hypothetical protein
VRGASIRTLAGGDQARIASRVLAVAVACAAAASPLSGQAVTGEISGRVLAADGTPLAGVGVTATGAERQDERSTLTDRRGAFRFPTLPVGRYSVRLDRIGHQGVVYTGVEVDLGRTSWLGEIILPIAAVALDPLTVEVGGSRFDPTRAAVGATLSASEFRQLPTGRDYKSIIQLLPHANASFLGDPVNVAGSTGLENAYHVEGVDVTDVYRGRGGTTLPYNFVEAVELKVGGYEAEYGGALGGIVNVVTRSGTNDLQVSGFGYLTGSGLSASPAPVPGVQERAGIDELDLGVSVAGPVVRDRVWFFTAYNPTFVRENVRLPEFALQEASLTRHVFAAKLDWRVSPRADLALAVFGDPTSERRVAPPSGGVQLQNPDPILSRHAEGGVNASLRGTVRIREKLVLEGSLSHHQGREDVEGATELGRREPVFLDRRNPPRILLSGGHRDDQELTSARTSVKVKATLSAGGHTIAGGLQYQDIRLDALNREDPGQVIRSADSLYEAAFFNQDFTVRSRVVSVFFQDSWAVTDRLRVLPGLRWDGQYLIDQNGAVGQRIVDQFQPRLGFTYLVGRERRHKIFGHVGRFYQQLALFWSTLGLAGTDQRQEFFSQDPRSSSEVPDSVRVFADPAQIRGGVEDLEGEHQDELVLGYEAALGRAFTVGVRGIHRWLRASVTAAFQPDGELSGGNPGRGPLSHLPASKRTYSALELTLGVHRPGLRATASYVLSRSHGNYPGLFAADAGGLRGGSFGPNNNQLTYFPVQQVNSEGLLPNDRTHVFKLFGAYELGFGLTVGTSVVAQAGTPLSEFGRVPSGFNTPLFLEPRGSEGRSPAVWNLDLRLTYDLPRNLPGRLILDVLHIGNPQEAVRFDQRRFNGARGSPFDSFEQLVNNQVGERPAFGTPIGFQPPFTIRLGLETVVQP